MTVLIARGAGVRRRRRRDPWLFRDLDVTVEAGDLVAVVGPPGSGRTTALLALVRRFRLGAGTVEIDGRASLGYVPDVSAPESVFTVTDHVRERLALQGRPGSEAAGVDLHGLDPRKQGQDLSPYEKQVLGLTLAELAFPAVIALDGYDDGLDTRERAALWQLLTELSARGTAVLFTAREIDPSRVTTVIRLAGDPDPSLQAPADLRAEVGAGPDAGEDAQERERAPRGDSAPGVVADEPRTDSGRAVPRARQGPAPATATSAVERVSGEVLVDVGAGGV